MFQPGRIRLRNLHQRAGPLREHEAQQALVRASRVPADHVADVLLGHLVVGQVERVEAVRRLQVGESSASSRFPAGRPGRRTGARRARRLMR